MMRNKNYIKKVLIVVIIALAAGSAYYYVAAKKRNQAATMPEPQNAYVPGAKDTTQASHVLINVPFTSQAPLGHWEDPRQEDGCEEASVLMAWLWVNNKSISPADAEKAITDMSDFEQNKYGNYHDFSAEDTATLMKDYYGYSKLEVKINPSIDDMKAVLRDDKIILIPTNGQILANPHYKQPGPLTHMIVVKGFDDAKGVFITNDPGTRYGEGYTFKYQTVYNAMVDYLSGNHLSQVGRPKAMIIVSK